MHYNPKLSAASLKIKTINTWNSISPLISKTQRTTEFSLMLKLSISQRYHNVLINFQSFRLFKTSIFAKINLIALSLSILTILRNIILIMKCRYTCKKVHQSGFKKMKMYFKYVHFCNLYFHLAALKQVTNFKVPGYYQCSSSRD